MSGQSGGLYIAPAVAFLAFFLLFLTCISVPFAQEIRFFTLVDRHTGGSIKFGLWGYCLSKSIDDYPQCSLPKIGWTFQNIRTLVGLDDSISPISTGILFIHPIAAICVFIVFMVTMALILKSSSQHSSPTKSRRKSSHDYLSRMLIVLAAMITTIAFAVDVIFIVNVNRRVKEASLPAKNMKAYTGAIIWLTAFAALILWLATIMLSVMDKDKSRDERFADESTSAYDSDVSSRKRDTPVHSMRSSGSQQYSEYSMHSRTVSVSHGDDEDWRADSISSRRSQLSTSHRESRSSYPPDDNYDSADDPPQKEKSHNFLAACLPCLKRRKDKDMVDREDDIELGEMRGSDTRLDTDSLRSRRTGKSSDMFHEERGMSSVKDVSSLDRHSDDPPEEKSHGFLAACLPCLKRRKDADKDDEGEDIELSEMHDSEPRLDTDSLRSSVESRTIKSSDVFDDEERVKSSVIDVSDLGSHSRYSGTLSDRGVSDNDGSHYSSPRTPSPSYIDRDGSEGSYASSRQQPPASLSYRKSSSVRSMSTLRTSHGPYSDDDIMIENESSNKGSLTNYPPGSGTSFRSDLGSISREFEGTPPSTPFSDGSRSIASYVGERTPSGSVGSVVSRDSLGTPLSSPVSNSHESYVSEPPVSSSYRSGRLSSYPASAGEQDYESGRGLTSTQISDRSPEYYESVEEFSTRPRSPSERYESAQIPSSPPDDRVSSLELYESGQPTSSVYRDDASRDIGQTPVLSDNEDYDSNIASFSRSLSDTTESPEYYRSGQSVPSTVYPTGEGDGEFERALSDRPSSVIQSSLPGLSSERDISTGHEGEHSLSTWRSSYASDPLLPSSLDPGNSESNLSYEPSAAIDSRGSDMEYSTGREGDSEDFIGSRSEEMSDMAGDGSYMSEPPGSSIVSNEGALTNYSSGRGTSFRSDMDDTPVSTPFSEGSRSIASYVGETTPSGAVGSVVSNDSFETPLSSPVSNRRESYVSEPPISSGYRSGPLSTYPTSAGEQEYESGRGLTSTQISDRSPEYHESIGEFSSPPRSSRLSSEGYDQESHPSFASNASYESDLPSSPLSDRVSSPTMYESGQPTSSVYRDDASRDIGQTPVLSDNEDYDSNIASFSRPLSENIESPEGYRSGKSVPSTAYTTDEGVGDFERTLSDRPSSIIQSSPPGLSSERDSFSPASTDYDGLEFEPEPTTLPSSRSDTVLDYEEEQVSPLTSHPDMSTGHEDDNPLSTWRSSHASDSLLPSSLDPENSESNLSYEPSTATNSRGSGVNYTTEQDGDSDFIGSRSEQMSDMAGDDSYMSEPPESSLVSNEGELTNYPSGGGTSFRSDMGDTNRGFEGTPSSTPFSDGSRSMASYVDETTPSGTVGSVVSSDSFETPLSSPVSSRHESYVSEPPVSPSYISGRLSSYPASTGERDYESGQEWMSRVTDRSPEYYESEEGSSSAQLSTRLPSEGHDEELHSSFASNGSYESAVSREALETPLSSPVSYSHESYESELPVSASYRSGPLSSYPASAGEQDYESGRGLTSTQISDRSPEYHESIGEFSSPPRSRRLSSEGYDEESHPSFASNASYESDLPSSPLSDRASSSEMYESGQPASSVYQDDSSQEIGQTRVLSDNEDYDSSNIASFSRSLSDTTRSLEDYLSRQSVPSTVYPTDDSGGDFERAPSDRLTSVIQSEPEPETPPASGTDPISDYEAEQVSPLMSLSNMSTDHEGENPLSSWRSSYESKSFSPSSLNSQYSDTNLTYESSPATNSRGSGVNYTTEQDGDSDFTGSRSEQMSDMAGDDSYMSEPPESSLVSNEGELTNYPSGSGTPFRSELGSTGNEFEGTPSSTPFSDGSRPISSYVGETTPSGSAGSAVSQESSKTPLSSLVSSRHDNYVSEPPVSPSYISGRLSSYPASTGERDYESGRGLTSTQISDRSPEYYESIGEFSSPPRSRRSSSEGYDEESHPSFASNASYESDLPSSPLSDRVSSSEMYESGQPASSVYQNDSSQEIGQTPVLSDNEDYDSNIASYSRSLSDTTESPEDYPSGQSAPSTVYPTDDNDSEFERAPSDRPSSVTQSSLPVLSSERDSLSPAFTDDMSTGHEGENTLSTWRSSYDSELLPPSSLDPENSESSLSYEPSAAIDSRGSDMEYSTGREGDSEDFIGSRSEEMSDMAGDGSYMSEPPGSSIVSNEGALTNYSSGRGTSFRSDMDDTPVSTPFSEGSRSMASYVGETTPSGAVSSVVSNDSFETPLSSPVSNRRESYVSEPPVSSSYISGRLSTYPASAGEQDYESGRGLTSQVSDRSPEYYESEEGSSSAQLSTRLPSEGHDEELHSSFASNGSYESAVSREALETPLSSPVSYSHESYESELPVSSSYRSGRVSSYPASTGEQDYESGQGWSSAQVSDRSPEYHESIGEFSSPPRSRRLSSEGYDEESHPSFASNASYESDLPSSPLSDRVSSSEMYESGQPASSVYQDDSSREIGQTPVPSDNEDYDSNIASYSRSLSDTIESPENYLSGQSVPSTVYPTDDSGGDFERAPSDRLTSVIQSEPEPETPPASGTDPISDYEAEQVSPLTSLSDMSTNHEGENPLSSWRSSYESKSLSPSSLNSQYSDTNLTYESSPATNSRGSGVNYTTEQDGDSDFTGSRSEQMSDMEGDDSYMSEPPESSLVSNEGELTNYPSGSGTSFRSELGSTGNEFEGTPSSTPFSDGSRPISSYVGETTPSGAVGSVVSNDSFETPLSSPVSNRRESYESEPPMSSSYRSGRLSSYPASTGERDYESGQGWSSAQVSNRSPEYHESIGGSSSPRLSRRLSSEGYGQESHSSFASYASYKSDLPSSPLSDRVSSPTVYESGQPASSVYRDDSSRELGQTPLLSDNEDYGSGIASFSRPLSGTTESPENYLSGQSVPSTVYPTDDSDSEYERAPSDRPSSVIQSSLPGPSSERGSLSPAFTDMSAEHEDENPLSDWRSSYDSEPLLPSSLDPENPESSLNYEPGPATDSRVSGLDYTTERGDSEHFTGSRSEEMSDMAGKDSYMSELPESSVVSNESQLTNYPSGSGTSLRSDMDDTSRGFESTQSSAPFSDGSRSMASYVGETTPSGAVGSVVSDDLFETPLSSPVSNRRESYVSEPPMSSGYRSGRLSTYPASAGEQDYESGRGWTSAQTSHRSPGYDESVGGSSSAQLSSRLPSDGYDEELQSSFNPNASYRSMESRDSLETPLSPPVSNRHESYESEPPMSSSYRSGRLSSYPDSAGERNYESGQGWASAKTSDMSPQYHEPAGEFSPPPRSSRLSSKGYDQESYHSFVSDAPYESEPIPSSLLSDRMSSPTIYESGQPTSSVYRDDTSQDIGQTPPLSDNEEYGSDIASFSRSLSDTIESPEDYRSGQSAPSTVYPTGDSDSEYDRASSVRPSSVIQSSPPRSTLERDSLSHPSMYDDDLEFEPEPTTLPSSRSDTASDYEGEQISALTSRSEMSSGHEDEYPPSTWRSSYESEPLSPLSLDPENPESNLSYEPGSATYSRGSGMVAERGEDSEPFIGSRSEEMSGMTVTDSYKSEPRESSLISNEGELTNYPTGSGVSLRSDMGGTSREFEGTPPSTPFSEGTRSTASYVGEVTAVSSYSGVVDSAVSSDSLRTPLSSPVSERHESYVSEPPVPSSYRSGPLSSYPASAGEQEYESGEGWTSAQTSDRSLEYLESVGEFSSRPRSSRLPTELYDQESYSSFASNASYESAVSRDSSQSPFSSPVSSRRESYASELRVVSSYRSGPLLSSPASTDERDYESGQGWTSAQTSNRSPEYLGSVGEFSSRSLSSKLPSEGYDQESYPSFVPDASYESEPIPSSLLSDRMSSPAIYESGQPISSGYRDDTSQDIGQTPPLSDNEEYGSDIASISRLLSDTTGSREDFGSGQSLPPTIYPTDDSDDDFEREPSDRPSAIIQSSLPSSALERDYLSPVFTDDDSMVSEPEASTPPSSESDTVLNYEEEYMSPLMTLSDVSTGHEGELPLSSSGSRHDSEPLWSSSLDPEKTVSDLTYGSSPSTDSRESALDNSTEREGDSEHFVGSRSGQTSDMEEIPRVCEYCGAYIYA